MGTMTFLFPAQLSPALLRDLRCACPSGGADNMPVPADVEVEDGRLTLRRNAKESICLNIPWAIEGVGRLMGSTATLAPRQPPYQLVIELARGKLHQVRSQASDWRSSGLQISATLDDDIRNLHSVFCQALLGGEVVAKRMEDGGSKIEDGEAMVPSSILYPPSSPQVTTPPPHHPTTPPLTTHHSPLEMSYQAAEQLVAAYVDQVFQTRHQRSPRLETALGCRLGRALPTPQADALAQACNTVCVPLAWKDVERDREGYFWEPGDTVLSWAAARDLTVTAGPLIDFSPALLPDWLRQYEQDLSSMVDFMCRYVENAVRHYRGRIRRWQLTAAANCADLTGLTDDDLLWLTNKLVQAARQAEPSVELSIGIAQPWGEYGVVRERYSPFMFADMLTRSGLNLSALDLEIVMGVAPRGSYCRDLLETSRVLDLYALLELPLQVTLGYPSAGEPDMNADPDLRVDAGHWRDGCTPEVQAEWAGAVAALALCKPYVRSVQWAHAADNEPHQFPHCGLIDTEGNVKPALERLKELREKHLR